MKLNATIVLWCDTMRAALIYPTLRFPKCYFKGRLEFPAHTFKSASRTGCLLFFPFHQAALQMDSGSDEHANLTQHSESATRPGEMVFGAQRKTIQNMKKGNGSARGKRPTKGRMESIQSNDHVCISKQLKNCCICAKFSTISFLRRKSKSPKEGHRGLSIGRNTIYWNREQARKWAYARPLEKQDKSSQRMASLFNYGNFKVCSDALCNRLKVSEKQQMSQINLLWSSALTINLKVTTNAIIRILRKKSKSGLPYVENQYPL